MPPKRVRLLELTATTEQLLRKFYESTEGTHYLWLMLEKEQLLQEIEQETKETDKNEKTT